MQEHPDYQFCPVCGGALRSLVLKGQEPPRLVCSQCDFIFYLDPKLVACSVVEMDHRIILLQRAMEPQKGKWVLPGGYVDRGEAVADAALRETEEECGIKTLIKGLLGVYSYPGRLAVVVVYVAAYVSGNLMVTDENEAVRLVPPEEIPWEDLAFQSTVDALKDYCSLRAISDQPSPVGAFRNGRRTTDI
jgi:8-oxo-dGTP diphosphatase